MADQKLKLAGICPFRAGIHEKWLVEKGAFVLALRAGAEYEQEILFLT